MMQPEETKTIRLINQVKILASHDYG